MEALSKSLKSFESSSRDTISFTCSLVSTLHYLLVIFSATQVTTMSGVKKPVNVFRLKDLPEPKGAFNWRLWYSVSCFGLLGAARGIDEGLITGAFNSADFKKSIHYDSYSRAEQADIKANVSAMVQIGCVGGALMYKPPT